VAALVGVFVGCGKPDVASTSVAAPRTDQHTRTVACRDGAITWTAELVDVDAEHVRIAGVVGPFDGAWTVVTTAPGTRLREDLTADVAALRTHELRLDREPRLVSPDQRCTLYLSPVTNPDARAVMVVGDSLAAGLVATNEGRTALLDDASDRGLHVMVDGQSGAPWAPVEGPDGTMHDELRGASSRSGVFAVVVVLGANDAILAAFGSGSGRDEQRARTDVAIGSAMELLRDVPCVIVTTPPDRPIDAFGLDESYAAEAQRVGDRLRELTSADGRVVVADFAEHSRDRHRPDGTTGDWFTGDDLHPNEEGTAALRTLLLDSVERCPSPARSR
jgi:hypothetical protein